jgi:hypothetical protein
MLKRSIATWNVYGSLSPWNDDKSYTDQIKPYGFHLTARSSGLSPGGSRTLIGPFETDSDKWQSMPWRHVTQPDGPIYRLQPLGTVSPIEDSPYVVNYDDYAMIVNRT